MSRDNKGIRHSFVHLLIMMSAVGFWLMGTAEAKAAIPQQERDALIALNKAMFNGSTKGGWLGPAGSECRWERVTCDAAQSHVVRLDLHLYGVSGRIPPEIGNLTQLTFLDLSGGLLSGSIPPEIGNLRQLTVLRIGDTIFLSGPIPHELGNLTQLTELDLSWNNLTGSIPVELGNLSQLRVFDSHYNGLTGSIPPELGNLIQLQILDLHINGLTGNIPPELGNLRQLKTLNLRHSGMPYPATRGSIPPELGNLIQLTELDLGENSLTGSIPVELCRLTQLVKLRLDGNHLTGSIPPEIGNLVQLTDLSLSSNNLTGGIPPEISNLTQLLQLGMWGNNLSGNIPATLSRLGQLQRYYLSLGSNALYSKDNSLRSWLAAIDPDWEHDQAVPPSEISAVALSGSSIRVSWKPISYSQSAGRYEVWLGAASGGPYMLAGWTADTSASSIILSGLVAASTYFVTVQAITWRGTTSDFSAEISVAMVPQVSADRTVTSGGAVATDTAGTAETTQTGYATVTSNADQALYATAVYSFRQNGAVVSETGVPASPPTTSARIFVDYRTAVALPGSTGEVNINTGVAMVNRGNGPAAITFALRDSNGQTISTGLGALAKNAHIAKYVNELGQVAPGFQVPAGFATDAGFGTLEVGSDQPLSVLALRLTINQRGETLMTSTPVADLAQPQAETPLYFSQFVDGGGYTTTMILMNTSNATEIGVLRLYGNNGSPLTVNLVDGRAGSAFRYSMLPGSIQVFQTDASPASAAIGWAEVTPDPGMYAPVGNGIFHFSLSGMLVTESGIAAATPTTHARIYIDMSDGHNTGLALANPGIAPMNVTMTAYLLNGNVPVGSQPEPLTLSGKGHLATFVDERIWGLPAEYRGVLDITSETPFAALTIRSLVNERNDFLITTFPVADVTRPAPFPILFPQIADGGGYRTEFILLCTGSPGSITLRTFGNDGAPIPIAK